VYQGASQASAGGAASGSPDAGAGSSATGGAGKEDEVIDTEYVDTEKK
jgi:hypothetical protein